MKNIKSKIPNNALPAVLLDQRLLSIFVLHQAQHKQSYSNKFQSSISLLNIEQRTKVANSTMRKLIGERELVQKSWQKHVGLKMRWIHTPSRYVIFSSLVDKFIDLSSMNRTIGRCQEKNDKNTSIVPLPPDNKLPWNTIFNYITVNQLSPDLFSISRQAKFWTTNTLLSSKNLY